MKKALPKKATKKHSFLKTRLGLLLMGSLLALGIFIYLAVTTGTGPLSPLMRTASVNEIGPCKAACDSGSISACNACTSQVVNSTVKKTPVVDSGSGVMANYKYNLTQSAAGAVPGNLVAEIKKTNPDKSDAEIKLQIKAEAQATLVELAKTDPELKKIVDYNKGKNQEGLTKEIKEAAKKKAENDTLKGIEAQKAVEKLAAERALQQSDPGSNNNGAASGTCSTNGAPVLAQSYVSTGAPLNADGTSCDKGAACTDRECIKCIGGDQFDKSTKTTCKKAMAAGSPVVLPQGAGTPYTGVSGTVSTCFTKKNGVFVQIGLGQENEGKVCTPDGNMTKTADEEARHKLDAWCYSLKTGQVYKDGKCQDAVTVSDEQKCRDQMKINKNLEWTDGACKPKAGTPPRTSGLTKSQCETQINNATQECREMMGVSGLLFYIVPKTLPPSATGSCDPGYTPTRGFDGVLRCLKDFVFGPPVNPANIQDEPPTLGGVTYVPKSEECPDGFEPTGVEIYGSIQCKRKASPLINSTSDSSESDEPQTLGGVTYAEKPEDCPDGFTSNGVQAYGSYQCVQEKDSNSGVWNWLTNLFTPSPSTTKESDEPQTLGGVTYAEKPEDCPDGFTSNGVQAYGSYQCVQEKDSNSGVWNWLTNLFTPSPSTTKESDEPQTLGGVTYVPKSEECPDGFEPTGVEIAGSIQCKGK